MTASGANLTTRLRQALLYRLEGEPTPPNTGGICSTSRVRPYDVRPAAADAPPVQRPDRLEGLRRRPARHRQLKAAAATPKSLHDGGIARAGGAFSGQQLLQVRRGLSVGTRRRPQRRVQGDHDAGFILQLDCPDLASGWNGQFRSLTLAEFRKVVDLHIEILNAATKTSTRAHALASLLGQLRGSAQS